MPLRNLHTSLDASQQVTKAQRIASIGSTGKSTNPHLHYEVRVNRIPIDPRRYLIKRAPAL